MRQLESLRQRLTKAYSDHQYHIVYHGLHNFCAVTLSSFYLDIIKDRLYTLPARHPHRRSAQTVLNRLAHDVCRLMAPVLCFTAEEIWQELEALAGRPKWERASVHAETFPAALEIPDEPEVGARWDRLMKLRESINKALEEARADKRIGTSLEAGLAIDGPAETLDFLRSFGDDLHFLLLVSDITFGDADSDELQVVVRAAPGSKCKRCWNYTLDVGSDEDWPEICGRCAGHVREITSEMESA
jgi:isoleucyl-tRNA synthetase